MDLNNLRFTKSHEWIDPDGKVGITDHAQHEITDVVFVELPKADRAVKAAEACTVVESVKAAFDIYAPVAGKVSAVNNSVPDNPALVNSSPYEEGWLFQIAMDKAEDRDALMTHEQYQEFIKSEQH